MKFTISTGVLFLFAFSIEAGTFLETFDDGDLGEWQELNMHNVARSSWKIIDGELQAINRRETTHLLVIEDETWEDYIIEFDVKPLKKHGPGNIAIAARIHGAWLVYSVIGDPPLPLLGVGSGATSIAGNFHENRFVFFHFEPSPFLKLNKWSTLKLSVQGDIIIFWVNGNQVFKTPDFPWLKIVQGIDPEFPDFLTGGVGFGLTNYTARFDNITITGDDIPDKGTLSAMSRTKLATIWGSLKKLH